jgi:opacity protein-like surface antigen
MKNPLLALVSVLVLAACGGASATASPQPKISFPMAAQNGSSVTGTADVVRSGDSFTLTVKLTGLAASSRHVSHIHSGRCSAPGGVTFALQQVIADSSGAATMMTVVPAGYSVPAYGWYVNIHHGPDFSAPANAPSVSCGDMPAS